MKKKIVLIFSILILISFTKMDSSKDTDELGNKIFTAIKQNNIESIKSMMVSTIDIEHTLDHFEMEAEKRNDFKNSFVKKIETDWDLTTKTIEKGFNDIRKKLESKKCKNASIVTKISKNTSKLRNLPFELGDLLIEFSCGKKTEKINVEIIKTESGWFILEKLRLINE